MPTVIALVLFSLAEVIFPHPEGPPYSRRNPIVDIVENVGPAVVNVNTEKIVQESPFQRRSGFWMDWNDRFFPRNYKYTTLGSGIIIDERGYILTNEHNVTQAASKIKIITADQKEYEAELIGSSEKCDIAVLQVKTGGDKLPFVPMGRSNDLMVGETVVAIGNPYGFSHSVTAGIISALGRTIETKGSQVIRDLIQTDTSINPGNSGGPLLNINGKLIGINTAIYKGAENIGFSIPIDKARKITKDLLEFGEARFPWLGIFVQDLTPALSEYLEFPGDYGVIVSTIVENGPADSSGIKEGDVLVSLGPYPIHTVEEYQSVITEFSVTDRVLATIYRGKVEKKITLKGKEFPEHLIDKVVWDWLGIKVEEITSQRQRTYNLPHRLGVVITKIDPDSRTYRKGIRPGQIIHKINTFSVESSADFRKAMREAIKRNMEELFVIIQSGNMLYRLTLS